MQYKMVKFIFLDILSYFVPLQLYHYIIQRGKISWIICAWCYE